MQYRHVTKPFRHALRQHYALLQMPAARWLWALMLLLLIATSAYAQSTRGYPDYLNTYVTDYANVIHDDTEAAITQALYDLRTQTGVEMAVLTINRRADYGKGSETMQAFATGTFNAWGVGDKNRNNGVLMVVAIGDREAFTAVGTAYENTLNAKMQTVFDEFMRPLFREAKYDEGIYNGVRASIYYLTDNWVAAYAARNTLAITFSSSAVNQPFSGGAILSSTGAANSASSSAAGALSPNSSSSAIDPEFGLVVAGVSGVGLLGAAGVAWRRYQRYRPRSCPDCGQPMQRLDEHADDAFLNKGQKLEEVLGSVDYDVWQCTNCNTQQMFDYKNHFGGHSFCPQCGYRTVTNTSRTVVPATYSSSGMREVTSTCNHCSYRDVRQHVIPQLERYSARGGSSGYSSSSKSRSRGSFGGGRSSGGGGGGSW